MLAHTLFSSAALAAIVLAPFGARAADPVPVGKAEVQQLVSGKVLTIQVVTATGASEKRTVPLSKLADGDDAVLQVIGRYYNRYLNAAAFQAQSAAS